MKTSAEVDRIVYLLWQHGTAQKNIARKLNISNSRVWQRIQRYERRMKQAMALDGFVDLKSTPKDVFEETEACDDIWLHSKVPGSVWKPDRFSGNRYGVF